MYVNKNSVKKTRIISAKKTRIYTICTYTKIVPRKLDYLVTLYTSSLHLFCYFIFQNVLKWTVDKCWKILAFVYTISCSRINYVFIWVQRTARIKFLFVFLSRMVLWRTYLDTWSVFSDNVRDDHMKVEHYDRPLKERRIKIEKHIGW